MDVVDDDEARDFVGMFGFVVAPSRLAGSECWTRSLAQHSCTKYMLALRVQLQKN